MHQQSSRLFPNGKSLRLGLVLQVPQELLVLQELLVQHLVCLQVQMMMHNPMMAAQVELYHGIRLGYDKPKLLGLCIEVGRIRRSCLVAGKFGV